MGALKRKPGAFARWVLRDAAFPHAVYRQTSERMAVQKPEREACWAMVGLLVLAADGHEAQLAQGLEQLIELDTEAVFYCHHLQATRSGWLWVVLNPGSFQCISGKRG